MECRDRLEFVLAATGTGMWSVKGESGSFECDARVRTLWGRDPAAEITVEDFLGALHPDDAERVAPYVRGERDDWPERDLEIRLHGLDTGGDRWIAMRGRRAQTTGGVEVVGTARDITDSKRYDAQVHLLMREVTHRSKNLLAIIQAMARRTVKNSLTASDFEQRFSARLRGLAFSHEILASQDWRGASLRELVAGHLSHILEHHAGRVRVSGPVVFVRPEAAQNLGLALHELSTNAAKFGALAGEFGQVSFEWQVDADENGPRWLRFTWKEAGDRAVTPPVRQGFGHEVMERVVARALDGIVQTAYPETGFEWSLRIPVSHISTESLDPS
jgi:two-component sensor histidine kinase